MNLAKMLNMTPLLFLGLSFASVPVFFWYPFFANGSSYFEGESELFFISICCPIPFFIAGLAMLSAAIQGYRTELETYVEPEQHLEHGTDASNDAYKGTWFPSTAVVEAAHPDDPSITGATDESGASFPTTPSGEVALDPAKDPDKAEGVFWELKPVDDD